MQGKIGKSAMKRIKVNASKKYDILIENGLLSRSGELISSLYKSAKKRICIVTDDIVDALYADALTESLESAGFRNTIKFVIQNGERSKTPQDLLELCGCLAENHITRSDLLIALGGGVVGDLCGFAASIYLRGVDFIQIPTTLLSCVDSSVGGKTAVDLPEGKNLIGTFYQPSLVICDPSLLDSLPKSIYRDGFAEVIKYGVILDSDFFAKLTSADRPDICNIIARSVEIKRDIVEQDERDRGVRALLNFGHTLGHGIELATDFRYSHGAAVAVGMVLAARMAVGLSLCDTSIPETLEELFISYGFDTNCPTSAKMLASAALSDKKRSGDALALILPTAIGKCVIHNVPADEEYLQGLIEEAISWKR